MYLKQELRPIECGQPKNVLPFGIVMCNVDNAGLDTDWLLIRNILL